MAANKYDANSISTILEVLEGKNETPGMIFGSCREQKVLIILSIYKRLRDNSAG